METWHYNNVIMGTIASQITCLTIVYSIVYSDADQRKRQSSASLTFVRGIHRGPVNSPHKWPVTRKMFPFDDVIVNKLADILQSAFCRQHIIIIVLHVFFILIILLVNVVLHKYPIDNESILVQVMAWHHTGDNHLPDTMITHWHPIPSTISNVFKLCSKS